MHGPLNVKHICIFGAVWPNYKKVRILSWISCVWFWQTSVCTDARISDKTHTHTHTHTSTQNILWSVFETAVCFHNSLYWRYIKSRYCIFITFHYHLSSFFKPEICKSFFFFKLLSWVIFPFSDLNVFAWTEDCYKNRKLLDIIINY